MVRATGSKQQLSSSSNISKSRPRKLVEKAKKASTHKPEADDDADGVDTDAFSEDGMDHYQASQAESVELESDALDEEDEVSVSGKKRKKSQRGPKRKGSSPLKKRRRENVEEDEEDEELPDGLTVVGEVVRAPTEGQVPPGQISQNTLDFLKQLTKPECNDRAWFRLHEPVFRQAEKEWKDWVEAFTPVLCDVDDQIPELPAKDVIYRIYRDVRFSNDKTPYKDDFSASFSRTGRKGVFAHYHIASGQNFTFLPILYIQYSYPAVLSGGRSLVAAGAWHPGKDELAMIRRHILHNSSRLRNVISEPEFIKFFGKPSPHPKRERQNIFGYEDELKVAPKGIDKNHKDIDLLKLRSVIVMHRFLDSEVLATDFKEKVRQVIKVMKPLVHCLNDMMTLPPDEDDEAENTEDA